MQKLLDFGQKLLEIGLSGWIIFIITILIGGGIRIRQVIRRKTLQLNIKAGGDVAGGDIFKGRYRNNERTSLTEISNSVQKDITALGDVAGGNIDKNDK